MATPLATDDLAKLLERCGHAHHAAFAETDGADPEWAIWYAGWLQAHLDAKLGGKVQTRSELVYRLIGAERAHKAAGSREAWPAYYAKHLLGP